jgi:citronellyl-CoA synthetase
VPGIEGKAGMVAFELPVGEELDLDGFQALVERELPGYAQPVFIRVLRSVTTTMTFKLQKNDLREQAFHPHKVGGDNIYVRKPRSRGYEPLDTGFYQQIVKGASGY